VVVESLALVVPERRGRLELVELPRGDYAPLGYTVLASRSDESLATYVLTGDGELRRGFVSGYAVDFEGVVETAPSGDCVASQCVEQRGEVPDVPELRSQVDRATRTAETCTVVSGGSAGSVRGRATVELSFVQGNLRVVEVRSNSFGNVVTDCVRRAFAATLNTRFGGLTGSLTTEVFIVGAPIRPHEARKRPERTE
jgi:hypothetical protein